MNQLCICCFIIVVCFYGVMASATGAASANGGASVKKKDDFKGCKPVSEADKNTTTFCFFSLNNPKEFHALGKKYAKAVGNSGIKIREYKKGDVEIKEFYGMSSKGGSVKENFKKMLQESKCDSLVNSGHHTGYFAGEQSIDKHSKSQVLDLNFIEEMSCEEGCGEWFANVKSLFLMGCQTVKSSERLKKSKDADFESIRISSEDKVGSNYIHRLVNQAYSSTLDQNDKLSHRYLRIFPNSSLYGWGEVAPSALSADSLPNFIDLVGALQAKEEGENRLSNTDKILNFIQFMNQRDIKNKCLVADQWTKHWVSRNPDFSNEAIFRTTQATACFLKDRTQFINYQKLGCDLTKALKGNNGDDIKKAVDNILNSGPEGIRANFNRLLSLVINRKNKKQSWYKGKDNVLEKLKKSERLKSALMEGIKSDKVGYTRKSDYLYFYNEMGWKDKGKDKEISISFLKQLQKAFNGIKEKKRKNSDIVIKSFHLSLLNSIGSNELQKWLYEKSPEEFDNFLKQYGDTYSASKEGDGDNLKYFINETVKYLKDSIGKG